MAREYTLSADVAYGFYCKYGYASQRFEAHTLVVCLRHEWTMVFYLLHRPLETCNAAFNRNCWQRICHFLRYPCEENHLSFILTMRRFSSIPSHRRSDCNHLSRTECCLRCMLGPHQRALHSFAADWCLGLSPRSNTDSTAHIPSAWPASRHSTSCCWGCRRRSVDELNLRGPFELSR